MKKYCFAAFAALFCVLSCNKAELQPVSDASEEVNTAGTTYTFTLPAPQEDTKLTLGELEGSSYKMKWQVGDVLQVYKIGEGSERVWLCSTEPLAAVNEDGSADFSFTTTEAAGTKVRLQQNNNLVSAKTYGQSILQYSQTYSGTGAGNLADLRNYDMNYSSAELKIGTTGASSVYFRRPLAMVRIPFKSTAFKGWTVDKVFVAREDGAQIAGEFSTNGSFPSEKAFIKTSTNFKSDYIEVSYTNPVTVTEDEQNAFALIYPTYVYKDGQETPNVLYKVAFQISKGGETKVLSARFNTCLKGGSVTPLKFGEMLATDEDMDYYSRWSVGADIKICDLTINKKTHSTASLKALDQINYTVLNGGGLVFVNDQACDTLDLHTSLSSNKNIASTKPLILVGRYIQPQKQSTIEVLEMRCCGDVAFLNITLRADITGSSSSSVFHIFSKNSSDAKATALRVQDCVIDGTTCTYALIGDRNGKNESGTIYYSAPFSNIYFDNSVIFCPVKNASTGEGWSFYRHYPYFAADGQTTEDARTLTLNNNVLMWNTSIVSSTADIINLCNTYNATSNPPKIEDGSSPGLKFIITNNNIINFSPSCGIRYINNGAFDASSYFEKNILYLKDNNFFGYTTAKVFYRLQSGGTNSGIARYNYGSAVNCYKYDTKKGVVTSDKVSIDIYSAKTKTGNVLVQDIEPFSSLNLNTGYVVVNSANTDIITLGAGATPKTFVAQ